MSGPDDLYLATMALLADAVVCLATTDAGAPGLAVPYPGTPAVDCCPMVTVHWTAINRSQSPPTQASLDNYHRNIAYLNLVAFTISVFRCDGLINDGAGAPNPAAIAAAAKTVADDAWALNHGITAKTIAGSLFGSFPCGDVIIGPVQQLTSTGGVVGCTMTVTASIQGYP